MSLIFFRWVYRGRVITNSSAPIHSAGMLQQYIIQEVARAEGKLHEMDFTIDSDMNKYP